MGFNSGFKGLNKSMVTVHKGKISQVAKGD